MILPFLPYICSLLSKFTFEKVKTNYPKQSNHFYNKDYATVEKIQQKISKDTVRFPIIIENTNTIMH